MKPEIELPPLPPHPGVAQMGGMHVNADCQFSILYRWAKGYAMAAVEAERQRNADWHKIADERAAEIVRLTNELDRHRLKGRAPLDSEWAALASLKHQYEDAQRRYEEFRQGHLDLLGDVLDAKDIMLEAGVTQDAFLPMFKAYVDRQRRGEPVGEIRSVEGLPDGKEIEVWADLPVGTKLYAASQPTKPLGYITPSAVDLLREGRMVTLCPTDVDGGLPVYLAQQTEPGKAPGDYEDLAHEIWAAAQTPPSEGIEDAVERIIALLERYGVQSPDAACGTRVNTSVEHGLDTPDAQRWRKARTLPRSWWRAAFNRIAAEGVTLDELIDAEMRRRLP